MSMSKKLLALFSLAMVLGASPAVPIESCWVCVNGICFPLGCNGAPETAGLVEERHLARS